ncbi:MAG: pyruvate, phosphate dikinase [Armatimonadota bacterium]|nr:pyruvate, phosphate dikinase [Armatimonadota bacterium]
MALDKHVFLFNEEADPIIEELEEEGRGIKDLLGGKGSNLMLMTNSGIPVPPGFSIDTDSCIEFIENDMQLPQGLEEDIYEAMAQLEEQVGKQFGSSENPLLVSVRSGAKFSMPGMMDTVLNLGMNDDVAEGMVRLTGDERFVYDAYRRFIMMFADVVKGAERELFEEALTEVKEDEGVEEDVDVSAQGLKRVVEREKETYKEVVGEEFPMDPRDQLMQAVEAVFASWDNDRAIAYREIHGIPHSLGTAVNVQMMVFGNLGEDSGTGVAFTRNPATGEKEIYGDFLFNAQGEDVVAGIRTPLPIDELAQRMPDIYEQFVDICEKLEQFYHDMEDVEFTVEQGKLWMLQTRDGKRTAQAAIKIASDMVEEGLVTKEEAVMMVEPSQLDQILHPQFDPETKPEAITTGVDASPGAATGQVVFTSEEADEWAKQGRRVILVRHETSPEDIRGMAASQGILTTTGGKTSHAAIVGRQMGTPCVVGAGALELDYASKQFRVDEVTVDEGDWVSIDGSTGEVMLGEVETMPSDVIQVLTGDKTEAESELFGMFANLMTWADEIRSLGVLTNADTPEDAETARKLGAQGIGLTRTEHMFFGGDRLLNFQKMIIADDEAAQREALEQLLPYQRDDFEGILRAMDGLPVIIRLLDPPLHEFLPDDEEDQRIIARETGKTVEEIQDMVARLHEMNPMLGHRGCRLGITDPLISEMQTRAIFEAACALKRGGLDPRPEVMIPLVGTEGETEVLAKLIRRVAEEVIEETGVEVDYMVGTMIELPRACLVADDIARHAEFFSFGTNDLTQTTFGFSRDDIEGKFLPAYIEQRIFESSPFAVLDEDGVGELVAMGVERGRSERPDLEIGICGEHGGDPRSIDFCHRVGLNYVSCSPLRVPIARLAAAQAQVNNPRD